MDGEGCFIEKLIRKNIRTTLKTGIVTLIFAGLLFLIGIVGLYFMSDVTSLVSLFLICLIFAVISFFSGLIVFLQGIIGYFSPISKHKIYKKMVEEEGTEEIFLQIDEEYDNGKGIIVETSNAIILPSYMFFRGGKLLYTQDIETIHYTVFIKRHWFSSLPRNPPIYLSFKSGLLRALTPFSKEESYRILDLFEEQFPHAEVIIRERKTHR